MSKGFIMKKLKMMLITVLSFGFIAISSTAAEVEITWTEPDKYSDIYASQESSARFQQRVFTALEKHFSKLAVQLPEVKALKIEVTDIDLAGNVHQNMRRIRVMTDVFSPRIKFSYQLLDENAVVLVSGEENLKDRNYLSGKNLRYSREFLGYEKNMLSKWFNKTFSDKLAKN